MDPILTIGVFVGGRSSRMGRAKGLLPSPGGEGSTLVERLLKEVNEADPKAHCLLVGRRPEYSALELPQLGDARFDKGPLGGLVALLAEAKVRGSREAIAIACDFPYLSAALIRRLAKEHPGAPLLCPRVDDRYQPLFARYSVSLHGAFSEALERDDLALMPLLKRQSPRILQVNEEELSQLVDWDRPEDVVSPS